MIELFLVFFVIGLFTVGGGLAMVPLISEQVLLREWMSAAEFVEFIALSESIPGPFATHLAAFIGADVGAGSGVFGGVFGALVATVAVVLPSFVITLFVVKFFDRYKESRPIRGLLCGLMPAAVGLIAAAVVGITAATFFPGGLDAAVLTEPLFWGSFVIFAACCAALLLPKKSVHPLLVVGFSAVAGILIGVVV